jgi:tRNA 2-selenouridine synthase
VGRWQQWAHEADLPHLFAELMALHYDPHYEKSQELHFRAWGRRRSVGAVDLSDQGIEAVAAAVLRLG